jgi:hypothetical protein
MAPLTRPRVLLASTVLLALGLLALLAEGVGRRVWELYERIDPAGAYGTLLAPLDLYVVLPLAVLGSLVLFMAPGLCLAMAWARPRSVEAWLLEGFVLSAALIAAASSAVQASLGELTGARFVALCSALTLASGALAWWRAGRAVGAQARPWPVLHAGYALSLVGVPLLFLAALLPKFLWESFNGDGAHAFEASRLWLSAPLPFWEPGSGKAGAYPGLNSILYLVPNAAFLRLFGEIEAAVRLPYLLCMGLLFAAVAGAAREQGPLSRPALGLIWAGVAGFSLVMAYSATYDPYCADIALPATQDALVVAMFLAMATAFLRGERAWALGFAAAMLLCSPAGPVLAAAWIAAVVLCFRERPWPLLASFAAGIAAIAAALALAPAVLAALGLPAPGVEHTASALLSKFRYVLPNDFRRFLWLALPCGIYPLWAFAGWRRADPGSRALLATALLVFAMYYLMAFVSLHYFAPAMLLPLAAFWRMHQPAGWRAPRAGLALCAALAVVSLVLGLPTTTAIYTGTRTVGASIDASRLAGYAEMRAAYFRGLDLLDGLFTAGWTPSVPGEHYAGSALAFGFYAQRARSPADPATYAFFPVDEDGAGAGGAPPEGAERVASADGLELYALDPARWQEHRRWRPAGSRWREVYDVPRDILFGRERAFERYDILDAKGLLSRKDPR